MLSITAITLSLSDGEQRLVAAQKRLVWKTLQGCLYGGPQTFLMNACAAERVVKRVAVKRREPHLLQ